MLLRQSATWLSDDSNFGKDTGLQARMLLTMFLLGLVYVVFIGVLFAAGAGAGLIVVVALVLLLVQLFGSDKIAMATMGVKEVTPGAGARAARDRRTAVRAGRPAQAESVRDRDLDAERLRDGQIAEERPPCAPRAASSSCSRRPSSKA